ncbi:MAG: hypothetical protein ABL925_12750, partial [Methylococcales bacterium]
GGVLMVTGPRGTGKTRIVDEALNERLYSAAHHSTEVNFFWKTIFWLFGVSCISKRHAVERQPQSLQRYLIRVDIDPHFPYVQLSKKEQADANTLAEKLIYNIVFGLTSVIDSRYSIRRHGKTLRAKLGFWRYWFAPNALLIPCHGKVKMLQLAGRLFLVWLVAGALIWLALPWLVQTIFAEQALGQQVLCSAYRHLLAAGLSLTTMLSSWLLLRFWDWHSLKQFSASLYDLVHAQELNHDSDREVQRESKWTSKLPIILLLPVAMLWLLEKADISLVMPIKNDIGWWSDFLIIGAALSYAGLWVFSSKQISHVRFGQSNPVWMITLLRRYLFLCHRCGLEPVLVLDDLDKLEDLYAKPAPAKITPLTVKTTGLTAKPPESAKLDDFLIAMARLKSSLGAEFLWILIGGAGLYERLQKDRHERPDGTLGVLGTVVHQEICLGPAAPEQAQTWIKSFLNAQDNHVNDQAKTLWLRARGNYSTMVRIMEAEQGADRHAYVHAGALADWVAVLWQAHAQKPYFDGSGTAEYTDKLYSSWVQIWIHAGMLDFANKLIKGRVFHDEVKHALESAVSQEYAATGDDNPVDFNLTALFSSNPKLLRLLGERILYNYLRQKKYIAKDAPYIRFIPVATRSNLAGTG